MSERKTEASPAADRIVREPECKQLTGLSRVTRWRLERAGKFPRRVQVSPGTMGWYLSELAEWLQSRRRVAG